LGIIGETPTDIGYLTLELISKLNECKIDGDEIMEKIKIYYDEEELSEFENFNLYISRKPEIKLIKLVNELDIQLYGEIEKFKNCSNYKNKLAKNTLFTFYKLPLDERNERDEDEKNKFKTVYKTVCTKLPSNIINGNKIDTDIEILKKEFTENLDSLFKIYLSNKYKTIKNNEMDNLFV